MAIKKNQNEDMPDFQNSLYGEMFPAWMITNDLWGGTNEIRKKEKAYLPQFNKEPPKKYKDRLNSSVFFNVFQRTVSSLVGLVFKNAALPQEVPDEIKNLFTDIDLCGNDIEMFLRESFTNAVRDGHSFIFIDAPPMIEREGQTTLADVADRRPFWINYKASQAVNWQYETIAGKTVLTQITFRTVEMMPFGKYGEQGVTKYKVLMRGTGQPGDENENGMYEDFIVNDKKEPVSQGERQASWKDIPVAVIYGRKLAPLYTTPPLLELAHLNILHYQKTSDFDDICHRLCVPILTRKLASKDDLTALLELEKKAVTISPAVMMNVFGENADLKYTEVTGAGLEIVANRIKELESQMSKLGLELLSPTENESAKTATEIMSDNSQSQSDLAVMAKNLETATEQAIYFTGEMINAIFGANTVNLSEAERNKFKLKIDYNKLSFTVEQMALFSNLVDTGKMTLETFLKWLSQIADMPKDYSPEKEAQMLRAQKAEITEPPKVEKVEPKEEMVN